MLALGELGGMDTLHHLLSVVHGKYFTAKT